MVKKDYGYVAATFLRKDIKPFQKLTEELCKEGDFYHSDTGDYIKGNVLSDLHLMIFYGLIYGKIDREELQIHIDRIDLKKLKLGGLCLRQIPNSPYQILWVIVKDNEGQLQTISESFRKFDYDESVQLEFMPHLTLAYVKPEYRLGNLTPEYLNEIKVEEIKYFER